MKILVTGAKSFAGRNLVENLKNIRDSKNKTRPTVIIYEPTLQDGETFFGSLIVNDLRNLSHNLMLLLQIVTIPVWKIFQTKSIQEIFSDGIKIRACVHRFRTRLFGKFVC